jgi:unsaturated chondroitin disaccharide hydrolase
MIVRDLDAALGLMAQRIASTASQVGERWPHFADPRTGVWTTTENADWTGAYWSGMLWIARATGQHAACAGLAARLAERLVARADDDTVSRGFLFYYGAALGEMGVSRDWGDQAAIANCGLVLDIGSKRWPKLDPSVPL